MRFASWVGGAALITVVAAGCSTAEPEPRGAPTAKVSQPIQGGVTDTVHKYAVGVCRGTPGNCFGVCSGALIAPNVIVTAKHCVFQTPQQIDCSVNPSFGNQSGGQVWITTHHDMTQGSQGWHRVQSVSTPDDNHICGNDIALLTLQNMVSANEAKPVIPGVQYLMHDKRYLSQFTALGYGNTSPSANDSQLRRIRQGIFIICTPGDPSKPCPPELSAKEFVAGDGTCSGDSGSSAFEQYTFEQGEPVSFGVLSRGGQNQAGTECEGSIYTRLDAHREFVIEGVKAASQNWALYPEPSWTTYVAPPTPADAGATDAPPKKPSNRGLGEECEHKDQCESNVCADQGDGVKVCSQACDEADPGSCPEGFACKASLCLPELGGATDPGASTTTTTTSGGCSVPVDQPAPWGWLLVAGAGALARSRRRRPR